MTCFILFWVYNYADDTCNTLSSADHRKERLVCRLEQNGHGLIVWFSDNQMQANAEKFQALSVCYKTKNEGLCFKFENFEIKCDDSVKRFGVTIDFRLCFDEHIS